MRKISMLGVSIAGFILAACATSETDLRTSTDADVKTYNKTAMNLFQKRGEGALSEQKFWQAVDSLRQALNHNPRNMQARVSLGEAYLGVNENYAARTQFRAVLQQLDTGTFGIQAGLQGDQGEPAKLTSAKRTVSADGGRPLGNIRDGNAGFNQSSNIESKATIPGFDIELNDQQRLALRTTALQGLGLAALREKQTIVARKNLRDALALDKNLWRSWIALARVYDVHRKWQQAEDAYHRAIEIAPNESSPYNNLGMSRLAAGDFSGAEEALMEAWKRNRDSKVVIANLRLALAWQGKYEDALAGVQREERANMFNNIGFVALMRNDYMKSQELLLEAIDASSSYFEVAEKNLELAESLSAGNTRVAN
jgi:Flp pilus assembly protein TadD